MSEFPPGNDDKKKPPEGGWDAMRANAVDADLEGSPSENAVAKVEATSALSTEAWTPREQIHDLEHVVGAYQDYADNRPKPESPPGAVESEPIPPGAELPKSPEVKEKQTLSLDAIKALIAEKLGSQATIEALSVTETPEGLRVHAQLNAGLKGGTIVLDGRLANSGNSIALEDPKINARGYVKSAINKNLAGLDGAVRAALEKKFGKPISSMQLSGSNLEVEFGAVPQGAELPKSPEELVDGLKAQENILDAKADKVAGLGEPFRALGQWYNKLPLKYKLAAGGTLMVAGGGFMLAGAPVPAALVLAGLAQRGAGFAGMFLRFENHLQNTAEGKVSGTMIGRWAAKQKWYKNFAQSDGTEGGRKINAALLAATYSGVMSLAMVGLTVEGEKLVEHWLGHSLGHAAPDTPEQKAAVESQPAKIEPQAQVPKLAGYDSDLSHLHIEKDLLADRATWMKMHPGGEPYPDDVGVQSAFNQALAHTPAVHEAVPAQTPHTPLVHEMPAKPVEAPPPAPAHITPPPPASTPTPMFHQEVPAAIKPPAPLAPPEAPPVPAPEAAPAPTPSGSVEHLQAAPEHTGIFTNHHGVEINTYVPTQYSVIDAAGVKTAYFAGGDASQTAYETRYNMAYEFAKAHLGTRVVFDATSPIFAVDGDPIHHLGSIIINPDQSLNIEPIIYDAQHRVVLPPSLEDVDAP